MQPGKRSRSLGRSPGAVSHRCWEFQHPRSRLASASASWGCRKPTCGAKRRTSCRSMWATRLAEGDVTISAQVLSGHVVQLSGNVSGAAAAGATVIFSGASDASVTADGNGNLRFSTTDATQGTVYAFASNGGTPFTPYAPTNVTVPNPSVTLAVTNLTADTITLSGTLTDVDPAGQTLAVSGDGRPRRHRRQGQFQLYGRQRRRRHDRCFRHRPVGGNVQHRRDQRRQSGPRGSQLHGHRRELEHLALSGERHRQQRRRADDQLRRPPVARRAKRPPSTPTAPSASPGSCRRRGPAPPRLRPRRMATIRISACATVGNASAVALLQRSRRSDRNGWRRLSIWP